jgi:hypothetical protein
MSFLGFSACNTMQSRTPHWRLVQFLRLRTSKHHLSTHASQTITTGGFSRANGMRETGFWNIPAGNYEKLACGNFLITGSSISVHNVSGLWFDMFRGRVLSISSILSVSQVIDTFREMIPFSWLRKTRLCVQPVVVCEQWRGYRCHSGICERMDGWMDRRKKKENTH